MSQPETLVGPDAQASVSGQDPPGIKFPTRRAYAQTFAATITIQAFGILTGVLAARILGPQGRGELAVIVLLPTLSTLLGSLGLQQAAAYLSSKCSYQRSELVSTTFWVAMILGLIELIVLRALVASFLPADKQYLVSVSRWMLIYIPCTFVLWGLLGIDQGIGRFGRFSFFQASVGGAYLVSILLLWISGRTTPAGFAFALLVGALASALTRTALEFRSILTVRPRISVALALMRRGASFHMPTLAGMLLLRTDLVVLTRLAAPYLIGLYAAAQAVAVGQLGAVSPFVHVGFTSVAAESDPKRISQKLAKQFRIAQIPLLFMATAVMVVTPLIIRLMFGEKFHAAIHAAYVLTFASMFWGLGQVLDHGLRAANRANAPVFSNFCGFAVILALGIPGCLYFGIFGLAFAVAISQLTNLTILIVFCVTKLGMPGSDMFGLTPGNLLQLRDFALTLIGRSTREGPAGINL